MGHDFGQYIPGDWWEECPVCGFDVRRKDMVRNYAGVLTCKKDYDPPPRRWKHTARQTQNTPKGNLE